MRLAAYAGASTALAGAVLIRAFTERPNFYSAAVYLGQSNACNLILMNFLLLSFGSTVFGLQRLLYGQLRPIEIEQLWDKGWYAVTETALAMTTFRDEVGGWFFILFMSLLAGKVWAWIGEGRVEILEQQPPANPRLFHARLIASLLVSEIFDMLMLRYCIHTLQAQPRPGMMVMFAFEFAVLLVSSTSTLARYGISAYEIYVEKQQRRVRAEERRAEMRQARGVGEPAPARGDASAETANTPPTEPEIDDEEVDVPGWQDKGRFVLFLDLATDFVKLILYAAFFAILIIFTGIPIHMFRDLFITLRSFLKRINDFLKYRNATKDMNNRYLDATAQDLERDNTCIICREDMHVWQPPGANARRSRNPPDERQRAKRLPCGHILHIGCLRSWLERQQVCPVCRASVLDPVAERGTPRQEGPAAPGAPPAAAAAVIADAAAAAADADDVGLAERPHDPANRDHTQNAAANAPAAQPDRRRYFRARTFGFGNYRMTFGFGNFGGEGQIAAPTAPGAGPNQVLLEQALERYRRTMEGRGFTGGERGQFRNRTAGDAIQTQLSSIERRITDEIYSLQNVQHQLAAVRALQAQLEQLRAVNEHPPPPATATSVLAQAAGPSRGETSVPPHPALNDTNLLYSSPQSFVLPQLGPDAGARYLPAGHPDLPEGLSLPDGWAAMPMDEARARATPNPQSHYLGSGDLVEQAAVPSSPEQAPQTQTSQNAAASAASGSSQAPVETPVESSMPEKASQAGDSVTKTHVNDEDDSEETRQRPDATTLPQWGSSAQASTLTSTSSHETRSADDTEAATSSNNQVGASESTSDGSLNSNGRADDGKGKGKVATVEDVDSAENDDDWQG